MGFARDAMRAQFLADKETLRKRALQAERNAEALAEEAERQKKVPGRYRPKLEERRKALRRAYADKMADPVEDDKAGTVSGVTVLEPEPEPEEDYHILTLEDLAWASPAAFARAQAHNLCYDDFEGVEPTSARGFRMADVVAVINAKAADR